VGIESNGRFTPNASKGMLERMSGAEVARALSKLDCGLRRDETERFAWAYEKLFTPVSVRRSEGGSIRERLLPKVQDVFKSASVARPLASIAEQLYLTVLDVTDGDWASLYVKLAISLGMDPDAYACAHSVVHLRRTEGKNSEDARWASEQFNEIWSKSDKAALDASRDFESVLRDVCKTCIAASRSGALERLRNADEEDRQLTSSARKRVAARRDSTRNSAH